MKREPRVKRTNGNRYPPHEFAKKARVTVRTLHHYDRIGLLKPSDYTGVGFRLYRDGDFVRLQQIVTLKFIGFSLKEIKRLLDRKGSGLSAALRAQRTTLEEKRRRLDAAIQAIAKAEGIASAGSRPEWETFQKITEEIQMQTNTDWMKKYYNDEAQKLIAERGKLWNADLQKKAEADWSALIKDIEAAAADGLEPTSPRAQALAERHAQLVGGFTGGHPAIAEGLEKLWKDQANWPPELKKQILGSAPSLFSAKAGDFLTKALEARQRTK